MGRFSRRFSDDDDDDRRPTRKPECYGDPDYYDITDDDCRACSFKGTCKLKVNALEREERRDRRRGSSRSDSRDRTAGKLTRQKKREYALEEPEREETFVSVLAYNSALNSMTTAAETLTEALGQIPRKRYPALRKRKVED